MSKFDNADENEDSEDLDLRALNEMNAMNSAIAMEKDLHKDESDAQLAKRLFRENSPQAANQIIALSQRGSTERVKLDASRYIIERVLGPINQTPDAAEKNPLEDLLGSVVDEVVDYVHANAGSNPIETGEAEVGDEDEG